MRVRRGSVCVRVYKPAFDVTHSVDFAFVAAVVVCGQLAHGPGELLLLLLLLLLL